jgi:hypothetical protein
MWLSARRSVAVLALSVAAPLADAACYDTGDGTSPPTRSFYFPVGLKVSHGGSVLYAVNSNFDLQYNGGTLQSYDLRRIRQHAVLAMKDPTNPELPLTRPAAPGCPNQPPVFKVGGDGRQPLGETCAPPTDSTVYVRDAAIIGAFATDLLLSLPPDRLVVQEPKAQADAPASPPGNSSFDRLFAPVRGNATITWASVKRDTFESAPRPEDTKESYPPFRLDCGQDASVRCNFAHQVGENPDEEGNTRRITMPGEPFGVSLSEDGASIVVTHQNETKTTLFSTGQSRFRNDAPDDRPFPAIQFVVDRVPFGGVGIAPIPHDPDAFLGASSLPRPAFLQTSRAVAQISLLRQYADEQGGVGASVPRPFLDVEATFPVNVSPSGVDSRGIVIDPTPRLSCKAKVTATGADRDRAIAACARKPARAFIANRSPAALLVGDLGAFEGVDGAYDPDRLTIHTSVPLSAGASKVYLAPIVDRDGAYSLRVFVVCFDSATIFIYDPDAGVLENVIRVAVGPFAMAFDPFDFESVARHVPVPIDARDAALELRRYRFAYIASFTQSFVQILDLDNAVPNSTTFERVVYTLGVPTNPKGS